MAWSGNIFAGSWRRGLGGTADSVEPVTGDVLGTYGVADEQDVATGARLATGLARPPFDRAKVLHRAAQLFQEYADEIIEWTARESGATRQKGAIEVHASAAECSEAASLATAPYWELLRSPEPRISLERRVQVGVVAVISPYNFPLVLSMRSIASTLALVNAVLLKPDPPHYRVRRRHPRRDSR